MQIEVIAINSAERHARRYERRAAARQAKKAQRIQQCDNFEQVFSYEHMLRSYRMSRRSVAWKASTQRYISNAPLYVYQTQQKLMNDRFRSEGFYEFNIHERGKVRHIRSVKIEERVVQRCLCDYALVPVLGRTFIYDNGASLKGKGYSFAIRRLTKHLRDHHRKYGNDGYILLFDFSKFFDNVNHALVKGILANEFTDERLLRLMHHFIDAFGEAGLGLGSQISQTLALASANRLDHYIKEICRIRGYGRYMDDGYLIHESKEHLQKCLEGIKQICAELGITLNGKKTQIIRLSRGFTFLKVRFFLADSGRIIKKMSRDGITRMRRKLKACRNKLRDGIMTRDDINTSFQSWRAYAGQFDSWRTIQRMSRLYESVIS